MKYKRKDRYQWVGMRFGRWTVLERLPGRGARVRCDCGAERTVDRMNLRSGVSTSCGCRRDEVTGDRVRKHGMVNSRTWLAWRNLRSRCTNPKDNRFESYAGRGITACPRWLESFEAFLADMGECPEGMSIERKNNDGPYEPGNCRWATVKEQARNRRSSVFVEHNGERLTIAEWAERYRIPYKTLWERLRKKHLPMAVALARAA